MYILFSLGSNTALFIVSEAFFQLDMYIFCVWFIFSLLLAGRDLHMQWELERGF